jgi:hypothetical protein
MRNSPQRNGTCISSLVEQQQEKQRKSTATLKDAVLPSDSRPGLCEQQRHNGCTLRIR